MKLAESLATKASDLAQPFRLVDDSGVSYLRACDAIKAGMVEALERAAQECENESENLSGNNARTADACAYRIRALISGDGQ